MFINKCKVCGKEFSAKQRNYVTCSNECRNKNIENNRNNYERNNHSLIIFQKRNYYKNVRRFNIKHVEKNCIVCGASINGNQEYCLKCLIIGNTSPNLEYRHKCKTLLNSRGYCSKEIKFLSKNIVNTEGYIHLSELNTVGDRFSQIMIENGYTNKEVSKMLGVNYRYITEYRNNKRKIPDDVIDLIEKRFNIDKEVLLNGV